jgi:capsular exopolysaccharide synthesis family protein
MRDPQIRSFARGGLTYQVWLRKWSVAAIIMFTTASAMYFSWRQPPIYAAESRVLVKPAAPLHPDIEAVSPPNMATEQEIARSVEVAQIVRARLGLEEPLDTLMKELSVDTPSGTDMLVLTVMDPRPDVARITAEAFGQAYLETRRSRFGAVQTEAVQNAQADIQVIQRELQGMTSPDPRADILADVLVQKQIELLALQTPRDLGELFQPGILLGRVGPNHARDVFLGLLIGLALGIAQAGVRGGLDDGIHSVEESESLLGIPALAFIPRFRTRGRTQSPLLFPPNPHSAASAAFASLRASFLAASSTQQASIILITSAWPGEGKTTVAADLGVSLARAGRSVTLICACHRKHGLEQLFATTAGVGLKQVLDGTVPLSRALVPTTQRNLNLLTCGRAADGIAEPLRSDAMEACLDALSQGSEFVLVDGPPLLSDAEAAGLVSLVDAVLLVIDARRMRARALTLTRGQLDRVNADVMGLAFNFVAPSMIRPDLVSPPRERVSRVDHSAY